jgi:hypothetical protein
MVAYDAANPTSRYKTIRYLCRLQLSESLNDNVSGVLVSTEDEPAHTTVVGLPGYVHTSDGNYFVVGGISDAAVELTCTCTI